MLRRSRLFRDYENVFTKATGLPLALRPLEYWQLEHHQKTNENPFCALLARRPKTLAVCLQSHAEIVRHTGTKACTETCPFGLTETAVPVRLGDKTIGFLRIGQVLRRSAIQSDRKRAAAKLSECGVPFSGRIRKAWETTPIIPKEKYGATVRLLTFFAEQLSALINQITLEKQNAEPPLVCKAREYIEKHKMEHLSLATVAQASGASVFHFCKVFKRTTGLKFTDYVARVRLEDAKTQLAESEPPNQRDRLRRRFSIAHAVQPHVQTRLRPVANRISRAPRHARSARQSGIRVSGKTQYLPKEKAEASLSSEIGFAVGFQSLSQFNRLFKKLSGTSPTQYRHSLAKARRRSGVDIKI